MGFIMALARVEVLGQSPGSALHEGYVVRRIHTFAEDFLERGDCKYVYDM
jgi:hypothetical protein